MSTKRRQVRVAERIKQEASSIILQELNDPRMGFVTVTKAEISPDLQRARVYISVLGKSNDERKTMTALQHAKGYIQREIAQRVGLRRAPILSLFIDEGVKNSARIEDLLRQIKDESGETGESEGGVGAPASEPHRREDA
ncbi:MAG: 30S ribosome-binding factor RbfA [Planctomycetes bacterium]|nr:30S ribosome-binding factor RbfA [Planctomycetota bacterium]